MPLAVDASSTNLSLNRSIVKDASEMTMNDASYRQSMSVPQRNRAKKIYPPEKWIGIETAPVNRRISKECSAFSGRVTDYLIKEVKNYRGPRASIRLSETKSDANLMIEKE